MPWIFAAASAHGADDDDHDDDCGTMMMGNLSPGAQLGPQLQMLKEQRVPMLYVFSERDTLVDKEIFFEMAEMMGATEDNVDIYDEAGLRQRAGRYFNHGVI